MQNKAPRPTPKTTLQPPSAGGEVLLAAWKRLADGLRRMAASLLSDEDEAEDVLQDAFVRLWPRSPELADTDEAARLLTATVRNRSLDLLRRRAVRAETELSGQECTEPEDTPDAEAEAQDRFARVSELIESRLTPTASRILRRKEYDGASFEQIAAEFGMTETAVRMQLSRARRAIREAYENSYTI